MPCTAITTTGDVMLPVLYQGRKVTYLLGDCFDWLEGRRKHSIHGVVTDPPFGLEYTPKQVEAIRKNGSNSGKGGVWRLPPAFDGYQRQPLPRFTTLSPRDIETLAKFFGDWASPPARPDSDHCCFAWKAAV